MSKHKIKTPLFVAIDTSDITAARNIVQTVAPITGAVKLGLEFFVHHGPDGIRKVLDGVDAALFLDLKLHDIPNTVAGGIRAAVALSPTFITIHASGGDAMMRAAAAAVAEASAKLGVPRPKILGVTVLTSLSDDDLKIMGHLVPAADQVRRLASLAQDCGLDGVICSPHELRELRTLCGKNFMLVCPGIRPKGYKEDDQKRTLTPAEAMAAGANYLVMGRPITGAKDPAAAAREVLERIT
jgi:orotidine-5'-phosphate decarboxylase